MLVLAVNIQYHQTGLIHGQFIISGEEESLKPTGINLTIIIIPILIGFTVVVLIIIIILVVRRKKLAKSKIQFIIFYQGSHQGSIKCNTLCTLMIANRCIVVFQEQFNFDNIS